MQKRVGAHDEIDSVAGPVELLAEAPHCIDRVKNLGTRTIHTRFRQRRHKARMRGTRQRNHREAMLEGAKLFAGLVRRSARGNKENAIQMKAPLGGARHGDVARVDWVEGTAE